MRSYLRGVISTAEICVSVETGKRRGNCFCLLCRSIIEFHRTICCQLLSNLQREYAFRANRIGVSMCNVFAEVIFFSYETSRGEQFRFSLALSDSLGLEIRVKRIVNILRERYLHKIYI